ncbi:MAG: hypothetical protein A3I77_06350 [Gammaproteobacteria bacterium RIFCSPLOWO2_02_FULL_42_14]|nr:MAG: hypothetical protein A3B71_06945 [Gammaproteobacteria bacterium RIFCSPHIGHO2_02_FULL_42_43]OGT29332.1 MAG: hypothetical protein A2624_00610 [Gammaproteobacteria bacterium RIFCSPHIGHO2_01_FULL_42_8]OGT52615.1 MAG: hypothetical protein A3E54_06545 [Gammaproteobacteria bacterium RIFCSPHIGHO2_12_FULL_41_25]OGT63213.1 MAG: hypothetical protein A3I77_06350 [Gammaproteobacteria bacterium RIFCSPLOWO2_02_FULL_42_14]OGT86714.1 MAG: hypothetical protein A3G86_05175 [Gammaproteobacteria bacterium R
MNLSEYIKNNRAKGRFVFTTDQAISDLQISKNALYCAAYKLKKKKDIISIAKHLYLIVPPEYQSVGSLPAEELLPLLMAYWKANYYVCGLSAAYYHGASHQKPQTYQVMSDHQIKSIKFGKVKIDFFCKTKLTPWLVEKKIMRTGYLTISSPELTLYDLFSNRRLSGGLNQTATVLSELIESLDADRLLKIIKEIKEHAWWQRLGYMLSHIDSIDSKKQKKLLQTLRKYAKKCELNWITLAPELSTKNAIRDEFWKLIANTTIETDE